MAALCAWECCGCEFGREPARKSTTRAAAGAARRTPRFAKTSCAIAETPRAVFLQPGYPRVCLWPDAVEKLLGDKKRAESDTLGQEISGAGWRRAVCRKKKLPLGAVYLLGEKSDGWRRRELRIFSPREAYWNLCEYLHECTADEEQRAADLKLLSRLVNRVHCKR